MIRWPIISVIIPSLNQGCFIEETIHSILDQNYPALDLIIIDGKSSDNTCDIIKKYTSKINYWESCKDRGQSHAINKGIKKARGEVLNWINSDDLLLKPALHEIAELSLMHPEALVFQGKTIIFNEYQNIRKSGQTIYENNNVTFGFGQINQPATFYRKSIFSELGLLRETLSYCMDLDFWLRFLMYNSQRRIVTSNQIWSKFRLHNDSKTIKHENEFITESYSVYYNWFNAYGLKNVSRFIFKNHNILTLPLCKKPFTPKVNIRRSAAFFLLWKADEMMIKGEKKKAFRILFHVNPFLLTRQQVKRYIAVIINLLFGTPS